MKSIAKWREENMARHQGVSVTAKYSHKQGCYNIAPHVAVVFTEDSEHGDIDHETRHLFARVAQTLLEGVLTNKRGTLVLDPISYRKDVGVFKKGGSALDAARISASIRGVG